MSFYTPQTITKQDDESFVYVLQKGIEQFRYIHDFDKAFAFDEKKPNLFGIGYSVDGQLVGIAGVNKTGRYTLEIGINVLENYEHQSIATKCVMKAAEMASEMYPELVLTYVSQFTHRRSINVATNTGFKYRFSEIMIQESMVK